MIQTTTATQLLDAIASFVDKETTAETGSIFRDGEEAYCRVVIEGTAYLLTIEEACTIEEA